MLFPPQSIKEFFQMARMVLNSEPIIKTCKVCGQTYNQRQWDSLPMVGKQEAFEDLPALALKNCGNCKGHSGTMAMEWME